MPGISGFLVLSIILVDITIRKDKAMNIYSKKTKKTFGIIICIIIVLSLVAPLLVYLTDL